MRYRALMTRHRYSNVEGDALLKCSAHQYNAKMITLPLTYQFDPASEVAYLTSKWLYAARI